MGYPPTHTHTLIINKENALQTYLQASLMETIPQLKFLFPSDKVTKTHHHNDIVAFTLKGVGPGRMEPIHEVDYSLMQ